ncbi:hypothetical protein O181_074038 [Austropuccinia psidii MF-1]|uniref:Reverse transcriptase RNase H-like domain-containing protein n=1 Tax=Austropuccinia psidii MF-1 TaxID=1389203 RepID=A0A9Q3IAL9_9BASI|nr:hypothetical protein [Austropuccinia psidii MF-1]
MDPAKLSMIIKWPFPTNLRLLCQFLGFSNFYQRFIQDYSSIAQPLTDLTKNGADLASGWNSSIVKHSFQQLIASFLQAPLLHHFDFNLPCVIQVDCSSFSMAGILCQPDSSKKLHPVCYYSRKWTPVERAWQVHDQELGAIVILFQEWQAWLAGALQPATIFSDHNNLQYFMTSVSLSPRQARWAAFLSPFSFCIAHIPGRANPADPPSWRADYIPDSTTTNIPILQMIIPSTVPNPSPSPISLGMIGTSQPSLLRPDPHFVFPSPAELSVSFALAVNAYIALLDQTQSEAAASLSRAKALQARYYDRGRHPSEVFQPGNRVLLSRRYISSLRPSINMNFAYLGPLEVDSMVGRNAVRLQISHVYPKLHPVFNISLVSRYRDPSLNPQSRWWFSSFQLWWIGEEWQWSWTSVGSRASARIYCIGLSGVRPTILGSPCLSSQRHWILFFPLSMNCILGTLPSLPAVLNNMLWEVNWQPHWCPEVQAYCHKRNITNFSCKIQH